MKNMLIVFFIIIFILLLLIFPFKTRLMGHLNFLEKKGFYSFKTWRIRLLCGRVYADSNNEIVIENKNNVIKNHYKEAFMKSLSKKLFDEMEIKKVELFFSGGFKENSFSSAIMCGSATSFVRLFYGYLSENYFDVKLVEDIKPTFDDDNLELTFDFVVSLSIYQILKSMLLAKIENVKERNNYGK